MSWRSPYLHGEETYDEMVERQRRLEDPWPGVAFFDEDRAERVLDYTPVADLPARTGERLAAT